MNKITVLLFILLSKGIFAQVDSIYNVQYFNTVNKISIRALDAVSDSKAWFAANRGVWGYTEDAGKSWHIDSIKVDTVYPQFRSIAVLNDSTVLLLSIESPAYLFKTTNKGKTWRMIYKNTNKDIFFDCMKFYGKNHGIAIGDPIDGCMQIIKTEDGGETWKQMDCSNFPKVEKDEGCFASSNSNIVVHGKHIWFVTGGKRSRIFHSSDSGNHFETYDSPLPQGEQMTGIYSIDFFDETTGAIAGGNYDKTDSSYIYIAITHDAGKTWKPVKINKPYFGSCVQFKNSDEIFVTGMKGTIRYNIKSNKIIDVKDKSNAELVFHTLRISPSGKALWLSGSNGSIALINLNK